MRKTLIIVDSFTMGGIQRLALDQAYALSECEIFVTILVLDAEPTENISSFFHTEKDLIKHLGIKFIFLGGSRYSHFKKIRLMLEKELFELVICHSLRGAVISYLCKKFLWLKPKIVTTIHQNLSMSAPVQRVRRIFYSQFTDVLLAYSSAVKQDWDYRRKKNPFIWLISNRKKISVCRNGVYLPRIKLNHKNFAVPENEVKRFIFVSRLTAWKGLPTVISLMNLQEMSHVNLFLITPTQPNNYLDHLEPGIHKRIESVVGKSVSQLEFKSGDLHLYPASYGPKAKFIEGISINVLEMACFGIKSLVTKGGVGTWPELLEYGVVAEAEWSDPISTLELMGKHSASLNSDDISKTRNLVDIIKNIIKIYEVAGLSPIKPRIPH